MEDLRLGHDAETTRQPATSSGAATSGPHELPVLCGRHVTLRAIRAADARSLFTLLTSPEVARFISPPPSSIQAFERFIVRTNHPARPHCTCVCFAVTLKDDDTAIGIFQVRELEPGFKTAEWGFALGSIFWGTGVFQEAAKLVLEFVFEQLGAHRVEARADVRNGRGARALQKLGAVQEGVLRKAFLRNGQYLDQVLYAIVADDWRAGNTAWAAAEGILLH